MAEARMARASPPRRARAGVVARAIAVVVVVIRRRAGTFLKFIKLTPDPRRVDGWLARRYKFAARSWRTIGRRIRSEEHTPELQSQSNLACRLLLVKKKRNGTERPDDRAPRSISELDRKS